MLDIRTGRKMVAILRVLREADRPLGGERIAEGLALSGFDLSERAVRNYLLQADALGWTENLGRRGRRLTPKGNQEIDGALVVDKVGFVSAKVDELAYRMTFDLGTREGKVIMNISTLAPRDVSAALRIMSQVYRANLGMGRLVAVGRPGGQIGEWRVPNDCAAIGTVCSVSINGVLLRSHIATTSRFGGLLQLEGGRPKRFTEIISYEGSSLDPLEIFIRGRMTSLAQAAKTGSGVLGASFREIPAVTLPEARRLIALSEKVGLGGVLAIGAPGQPLLDISVPQRRVGLVICGGLNPLAAVVENGIRVTNAAMSTLCGFEELVEFSNLNARNFVTRSGDCA